MDMDKVKPKLRTYVHVRVLYAYIGSKYEYFRTMTYMDNCHVPCFLLYFNDHKLGHQTQDE